MFFSFLQILDSLCFCFSSCPFPGSHFIPFSPQKKPHLRTCSFPFFSQWFFLLLLLLWLVVVFVGLLVLSFLWLFFFCFSVVVSSHCYPYFIIADFSCFLHSGSSCVGSFVFSSTALLVLLVSFPAYMSCLFLMLLFLFGILFFGGFLSPALTFLSSCCAFFHFVMLLFCVKLFLLFCFCCLLVCLLFFSFFAFCCYLDCFSSSGSLLSLTT